MENALLMGFMTIILITFLVVVTDRIISAKEQKDIELLKDLGDVIQNEIELAQYSSDGYMREFSIPYSLLGKNFNITVRNSTVLKANYSEVVITYTSGKHHEIVVNGPRSLGGWMGKGLNNISRRDGTIYLNSDLPI